MAFKNVNGLAKFYSVTSLEVGESLIGYVIGFETGGKYNKTNIILQTKNEDGSKGERLSVSTAGNLSYMVKDNKLSVGLNTRITRKEDKKVKGKTSSQYLVEQDDEDTIPVNAQPTKAEASASSMASTLSSLKGLQ